MADLILPKPPQVLGAKKPKSPPAENVEFQNRALYDLAFMHLIAAKQGHNWGDPIVLKRPCDDGSTCITIFSLPVAKEQPEA